MLPPPPASVDATAVPAIESASAAAPAIESVISTRPTEPEPAPMSANSAGPASIDAAVAPSIEPAITPRKKAKRASRGLKANGSTGIVPDTVPRNTGNDESPVQHRKPFSDITTTTTTTANKLVATNIDILTVPSSIREQFAYLRTELQGMQENQLLLDWLALECEDEAKSVSHTPINFLLVQAKGSSSSHCQSTPVASRPKAVLAWTRRKECDPADAPEFDVSEFGGEMRKWWSTLMPKWRHPSCTTTTDAAKNDSEWPLKRNTPDTESWSKVRKVGPNGLFLVLLGLAWWKGATAGGGGARREYSSVAEDVAWVIGNVVKDVIPFASRERQADPPAPPASSAETTASPTAGTTTKRGRTSRPSQKKLGLSGLSPTRVSKRARYA